MTGDGWHDADPAAVAAAVHYALRFSLTGKAHGKRARDDEESIARHVVLHLLRANYRILQGPSAPPHSTSNLGKNPGGMPEGWAG